MGLKKQSYFKKIIIIFGVLLLLLSIFRLNIREFFLLKQETENSLVGNNDNFAFLNTEHVGILFENKEENSAFLLLPDNGYEYDISEFLSGYKNRKKLYAETEPVANTIYVSKKDTSCISKQNCGESFEKILNLAEKYNMMPTSYDLTDKIVFSEK